MKIVKMAEQGNVLPIGKVAGKELVRDVSFKPWTMVQERAIGDKRKESMSQGNLVTAILCEMVVQKAGENFGAKPESHRLLDISQAWMADVLYAYLALRREALGNDINIKITCANCRSTFDFQADLGTMNVRVIESPDELLEVIELKNGFTYQGAVRKLLTIAPAKWSAMEAIQPDQVRNSSSMAMVMFQSAIVEIEGVNQNGPLVFDSTSFDDMTKRDINFLQEKITEHNAGPEMAVEGKCPRCTVPFVSPIRWEYDNFF